MSKKDLDIVTNARVHVLKKLRDGVMNQFTKGVEQFDVSGWVILGDPPRIIILETNVLCKIRIKMFLILGLHTHQRNTGDIPSDSIGFIIEAICWVSLFIPKRATSVVNKERRGVHVLINNDENKNSSLSTSTCTPGKTMTKVTERYH